MKRFFWYCSGADIDLLEQCPSEENKYVGIGGVIFFTGLLAAIAASYALFTIFDSWIVAVIFGLIWGAMIFNLDRYIVSSMKKEENFGKELKMALPRLILALLIAVVISKPLELKIFEKEIETELVSINEGIYAGQLADIQARYQAEIDNISSDQEQLEVEVEAKVQKRDTLSMIARQEADGTGGTMQKNLGPIYKIKKQDADQATDDLNELKLHHQPLIDQKIANINQLELQQNQEMAALPASNFTGLAARIQALDNLGVENRAIYWASIFIMLLFISIESAPVFVKLLADRGPYDELLEADQYPYVLLNKKKKTAVQDYDVDRLKATILNRGLRPENAPTLE